MLKFGFEKIVIQFLINLTMAPTPLLRPSSHRGTFLLQRQPRPSLLSSHIPRICKRNSSSRNQRPGSKEPLFQIPAHLAAFTLLLLPVAVYTAFFYTGRDDRREELEEKIRARYGDDHVHVASTNNRKFAEFYQSAILSDEQDARIQKVLYAGKGEKKRFHTIDPELYGTEKGVVERNRVEQERLAATKRRKEKRKKQQQDSEGKEEEQTKETASAELASSNLPFLNSQTASVAAVGILAAAVGFILGGRRNS